MTDTPLTQEASRLLGEEVVATTQLHGGGLSEVVRLSMASGHTFVAKTGRYPEREADMLRAMIAAGANAPAPIKSSSSILILEDLGPSVPGSERCWQQLGETLRTLHASTGDSYGWEDDYAFGPVQIRNRRFANWAEFWIENRLLVDVDQLPEAIVQRLSAAKPVIRNALPDTPPASLLHGDLWSGNVHFTDEGKAWLIDPACFFGHAEVDLAMLTLFGSPPGRFWSAYGPLDNGWQIRRNIYQLWPALVHLRLFGDGYRSLVERLLSGLEQ
ncbi:Fructosamine-3-kinase [Roseibium album]|nr:Fructosamine-3-kinase [Roseibium album]